MKRNILIATLLIAAVILVVGCAKDEPKVEVEEQEIVSEQAIPTLTQADIDSFIKIFPKVQGVVDKYRAELEQNSGDSPVEESKTTELMAKIESEMLEMGIIQDWFFGIYQKVIFSAMYMNAVRQAESLKPENIQMKIDQLSAMAQSDQIVPEQKAEIQAQIDKLKQTKQQILDSFAQLAELKAKLTDPQVTEPEKAQIQATIQQLEQMLNPAANVPEGISQEELKLVEVNMPRLMTALEQFSGQAQQSMPAPDSTS